MSENTTSPSSKPAHSSTTTDGEFPDVVMSSIISRTERNSTSFNQHHMVARSNSSMRLDLEGFRLTLNFEFDYNDVSYQFFADLGENKGKKMIKHLPQVYASEFIYSPIVHIQTSHEKQKVTQNLRLLPEATLFRCGNGVAGIYPFVYVMFSRPGQFVASAHSDMGLIGWSTNKGDYAELGLPFNFEGSGEWSIE